MKMQQINTKIIVFFSIYNIHASVNECYSRAFYSFLHSTNFHFWKCIVYLGKPQEKSSSTNGQAIKRGGGGGKGPGH